MDSVIGKRESQERFERERMERQEHLSSNHGGYHHRVIIMIIWSPLPLHCCCHVLSIRCDFAVVSFVVYDWLRCFFSFTMHFVLMISVTMISVTTHHSFIFSSRCTTKEKMFKIQNSPAMTPYSSGQWYYGERLTTSPFYACLLSFSCTSNNWRSMHSPPPFPSWSGAFCYSSRLGSSARKNDQSIVGLIHVFPSLCPYDAYKQPSRMLNVNSIRKCKSEK